MNKIISVFLFLHCVMHSISFSEDGTAAPPDAAPGTKEKSVSAVVEEALIQDFGIYEVTAGPKVSSPNVTTGQNTVIYSKSLIAQVDTIPAVRGISFGFRYVLKGRPNGKTVPVTIQVNHPPITNPNTRKTIEVSFWEDGAWIGLMNWHTGWSFDESWEIVPGIWTISLIYEGRVLAKKVFTVKKI